MIEFRSHTVEPDLQITALIARLDKDGDLFLASRIYKWNGDHFHAELDTDDIMDDPEYYWLPESEALSLVRRSR